MTEGQADRQTLFMVGIGPEKTGTTWLDRRLRPHPELSFPARTKETFFWDRHHDNGLDWYRAAFGADPPGRLAEVGPSYFRSAEARARLQRHNRFCRILVSLRDPAVRSFSHYVHHLKRGRVSGTFWEAAEVMPEILDASRYSEYLPGWLDAFGTDGVMVVLTDDMSERPVELLEQIHCFLGIPEVSPPEASHEIEYAASMPRFPQLARLATGAGDWLQRRHITYPFIVARRLGLNRIYKGSATMPRMDSELRGKLVRRFSAEIDYVEKLTGRTLDDWKDREIRG